MNDFPKKKKDLLPTSFVDTVEAMAEDEMKEVVMKCEQIIVSTKQDMSEDDKLNGAKELLKDLSHAYKETIKVQQTKIEYIMHVRKQRGNF